MGHIVGQRDDGSLRDDAEVHADGARVNQHEQREIDENVGERVHQSGNPADEQLLTGELLMALPEAFALGFFLAERTQNADAGEVLARLREHGVEAVLHTAVERNRDQHDAEHDNAQNRNDDGKYDRCLRVNKKCHD